MSSTEKRIQELKKRPKTPEVLNSLGDLYLRLRDTASAVACYYDAVDMIPVVQRDKRVALFKKIIMNAPNDPEAYEGLVDIYRRMGLFGEEKRYLHILDDIYTSGGYADRLDAVKQRLRVIENGSGLRTWMRREEKPAEPEPSGVVPVQSEQELPLSDTSPEEKVEELILHNETPQQAEIADAGSDGLDDMSPGEIAEVQGRAGIGLFSVELEEVRDKVASKVEENRGVSAPPALPRIDLGATASAIRSLAARMVNPYVIGAVVVCVLVIYMTFFFDRTTFTIKPAQGPEVRQIAPFRNIDGFVAGNFEISVTELTNSSFEEKGLDKVLSGGGTGDYRFVSVSVRAARECLPVSFAENPHGMVSFILNDGSQRKVLTDEQLSGFNRVIFKANYCDSDFAPVFVRFFLYYTRDSQFKGLRLDGLHEGETVNVFWN